MEYDRKEHKDLRDAVIQAHPGARTTYELAHQLTEILPIESHEDFVSKARLSVGGKELPAKELAPSLPAELFPIRDQADLVKKVAAVVRVAGQVMQHDPPTRAAEAHMRVAFELAGESPASRQVGAAVFRGPPLFKVTKERS
jgi:LmbE family N-acetylglucosaminyl deacetylase